MEKKTVGQTGVGKKGSRMWIGFNGEFGSQASVMRNVGTIECMDRVVNVRYSGVLQVSGKILVRGVMEVNGWFDSVELAADLALLTGLWIVGDSVEPCSYGRWSVEELFGMVREHRGVGCVVLGGSDWYDADDGVELFNEVQARNDEQVQLFWEAYRLYREYICTELRCLDGKTCEKDVMDRGRELERKGIDFNRGLDVLRYEVVG